MTQIYLSTLDVTEFRNFARLTVKLPSRPGAMLVHGTNGLGKSSLFDGLEWALTGKIDRFAQSARGTKEMHYLRRWRAHADRPTAITKISLLNVLGPRSYGAHSLLADSPGIPLENGPMSRRSY